MADQPRNGGRCARHRIASARSGRTRVLLPESCPLTSPNHTLSFARTVSLLTVLLAGLSAPLAMAEEVVPPAPPKVDAPPPPPVPATVDLSLIRVAVARPVYATQPAQPVYAQPAYQSGDPYGFTAWLNGVRAQNGRGPVGHDPGLSAWAAVEQRQYGSRPPLMGSARRQNCGHGRRGDRLVDVDGLARPPGRPARPDDHHDRDRRQRLASGPSTPTEPSPLSATARRAGLIPTPPIEGANVPLARRRDPASEPGRCGPSLITMGKDGSSGSEEQRRPDLGQDDLLELGVSASGDPGGRRLDRADDFPGPVEREMLLNTARPTDWRSGWARSSSSLRTSTRTAHPWPVGAGSTVMIANRRIDCKVHSSRSWKPTESPSQGSSRVAPDLGCVTILRWMRSSVAMSKYWLTATTLAFQTASKSPEGTMIGLSAPALVAAVVRAAGRAACDERRETGQQEPGTHGTSLAFGHANGRPALR